MSDANKLFDMITGVVIVSAIIAVPVSIAAKLLRTNLNGFGFAFVASLCVFALQTLIGTFIPWALVGLPLAIAGSILIFSYALGTSLPKASLVFLIVALCFGLFGVLWLMVLGGEVGVTLYGHDFSFHR